MNALSVLRRMALRMLWIVIGAAFFSFSTEIASARFYPVEEVRPGTRGTGKTVMRGTTVESFEVEYIGVMRDAGPSGDLILIRVSGAAIDQSGGIAAGMSGSPVYIDDQLVGAIGYGFNMADHRVGLVTPIGDMLQVLELVGSADDHTPAPGPLLPSSEASATPQVPAPRGVILTSSVAEARELMGTAPEDTLVFAPARTPLLASGFSPRALADLEQRMKPFNFWPVVAGGAPDVGTAAEPLQPGSAFGVQLARGDVTLTSIGTVTYIDDDRFVGFGHPFTNRGSVEFVASSAYVHDVVQAASMPFKLGAPLEPVGTLLQDRGAAVGARLGTTPHMIPVTISVHDADRNTTSLRQFEIVRDNEYTVALATTGALALLDRSLDRLGRGTARVVFRVEGEGLERPLVRDNLYYSDFDISALSLLEFMEAVSLVVNNRFQPVEVTRIHVSAQVEQQRHTAHIEQARPDRIRVRPGEDIEIEVALRPYRQPPIVERLQLTVPKDALPGVVTVEVRGGGWGLRPPVQEDDTILDDPEEALGETVSDLTRLVEQFTRRERNNELVAEFYSPRRREEDDGAGDDPDGNFWGKSFDDEGWHETFPGGGWVVATRSTDYVLLGSHIFELQILRPKGALSEDGDADDVEEALPEGEGLFDPAMPHVPDPRHDGERFD